jgi:FtsH-binding integral membrane protein
VPTGAVLVAKATSVTAQVAGMVGAPLIAWCLVLGRSATDRFASVLLVVLLCAASGAGATLGSVLGRRTEGSRQSTVERDPVATIVHGVALVVAVLPVVAGYALDDDGVLPAVTAATSLVLLAVVGVVVARTDALTRGRR